MKFLIVDDDARMHMLLLKYLEEVAECETAVGGDEALAAFKAAQDSGNPFDAVCMDILMPGMDGHEVVAEMRRMEKEKGVPGVEAFKLVMITVKDDVKHVTRAFFKGHADCYLVKPFDKAKILTELRNNKVI